ncbi:hypothetical protein SETIT_7G299500v2 [Setaria italica]|uniref:Uncharacterized protein n=2 Tax=Setaria italica TaxID=4555 RepID=A0A368S1A8_SETIT|nr:uncharacterized protein LOC101765619 [Setaria italica]RCV36206.1 hypothetical protein SETIT_7G299500v2 [Setaria italica]
MAPASPRRCRVPSSAHAQPTSTSHAGAPPHRRRSAVLVIPGAGAMDRLLLSRPPLPVPTHAAAGADGDLLELDVLWPSSASASSAIGLGLLAALPEDEGKKKKRAAGGGPARSAARPVPETAALAASGMARSAPVRIPSEPSRRGRWAHAGAGGWEDAGEAMVPPHEIVARRAAAHSSVLEGAGRTLKGRDLRRVRNAVLRRTGFLD